MRYLRPNYTVTDDFYDGLSESERFTLENCSTSEFKKLINRALKTRSVYKQQLEGKIDLSEIQFYFLKDYTPSVLAFRSYLYLQTMLDAHFGQSYYTTRSNLHSYIFMQTISGAGNLTYQGSFYELNKGDVCIIDCRKLHDYRTHSPEGWHYRLVHFAGSMMSDIFEQILNNRNVKFYFEENSEFTSQFKELFRVNEKEKPENEILSNKILHSLLAEILVTLPQFRNDNLPVQFREIDEYITQNCCEHLTLENISAHFRISKYHMSRQFKKYTGRTVLRKITEERMKRAKEFLRYTSYRIEDITENIGYENVSHFSRLFKKYEKMTPSEYRRIWRGL